MHILTLFRIEDVSTEFDTFVYAYDFFVTLYLYYSSCVSELIDSFI